MNHHSSPDLVFWDVDTQFDFMTPPDRGGALYVRDTQDDSDPGAERILDSLLRLTRLSAEKGILRVATGDWHSPDDREIDAGSPDFVNTFPPHCMAGSPGAERITETALRHPLVLPVNADPALAWDVARRAIREGRDIFVQKREFDCFLGNRATDALVRALDPGLVVVYGVALDVCVRWAVEGLLERGRSVWLVRDATWGLGILDADTLIDGWRRQGITVVTTDQVVDEIDQMHEGPIASPM